MGVYTGVIEGGEREGGEVSVSECVSVDEHSWVGDTRDGGWAGWVKRRDGRSVKRWMTNDRGEECPFGWRAGGGGGSSEQGAEARRDDVLRASCLCRGVEFVITRPNEETGMYLRYPRGNRLG